jgi:hypothetical protein
MATTVAKNLRLEKRCRPYANNSVDELFDELVRDAEWAKGLLDFAQGMYAQNNTDKIDASAVMAFVDSVRGPICNVVDALAPIMYELKQREEERRA